MASETNVLRTLQTFLKKSLSQADLTPPIYRVLLTSWFVFNWQAVFYILASSDDASVKLRTINSIYIDLWANLLFPLITSIIYLLFSPPLKNLFTYLWTYSDRTSSKHLLASMKSKVTLTEDEQNEHMKQVEQMLRERDEVIYELRRRNKELKNVTHRKLLITDSISTADGVLPELGEDGGKKNSESEPNREDLVSYINSTDGNYQLMKYIAPKLLLDIDDPGHKKELDTFLLITKSAISEYPSGWFTKELNAHGTRYSPAALRSLIKKMEHAGLIHLTSKNGVPEARISDSLLRFLTENIPK